LTWTDFADRICTQILTLTHTHTHVRIHPLPLPQRRTIACCWVSGPRLGDALTPAMVSPRFKALSVVSFLSTCNQEPPPQDVNFHERINAQGPGSNGVCSCMTPSYCARNCSQAVHAAKYQEACLMMPLA